MVLATTGSDGMTTTERAVPVWEHGGVAITVDVVSGRFRAEVGGAEINEASLREAREKVEAQVTAQAKRKREAVEAAVFVDLTQAALMNSSAGAGSASRRGFLGVATFRGFSAKNGDALFTLPGGQKISVAEFRPRFFHPAFPERARYEALAKEQDAVRARMDEIEKELTGIVGRHAVTAKHVSGSDHGIRVTNDHAKAAEYSATLAALIAQRGEVAR